MARSLYLLCVAALIATTIASNALSVVSPQAEPTAPSKKGLQLTTFSAFAQSLSSIIVSELGDKTFFIAAIMSMRYSRIAVLLGALLALLLMTIISTAFGWIVPVLLPPHISHIAITILFFFFGVKLLYDSFTSQPGEHDEQAEVEQELNQVHSKMMKNKGQRKEAEIEYISEEQKSTEDVGLTITTDIESSSNGSQTQPQQTKKSNYSDGISKKLVFWQALTMTFLGEWGDRSQITTIALAAEGKPFAVCVGSFLGHVICTTLAVIGGKFLAKKISEKTVNISGGVLFLIFGVHNLLMNE